MFGFSPRTRCCDLRQRLRSIFPRRVISGSMVESNQKLGCYVAKAILVREMLKPAQIRIAESNLEGIGGKTCAAVPIDPYLRARVSKRLSCMSSQPNATCSTSSGLRD